jgi:lactobin A/cerein 7B family class IIb bacteriocin
MKNIDESELHAIEGGVLPWIVTIIVGAVIGSVVSGWSDFKEGAAEAYARELTAS